MEKLRLSNTRIQAWQHCHLRYKYCYIDNLVPKEKAEPLQVGDIVHQLIHKWVIGEFTPDDIANLDEFVKTNYPEDDITQAMSVAIQAATLIQGYLKKYQDDPLQFISSEIHIEHDLGPCILVGKVDALARPEDNKLWRVEHKTTSRVDSYYLNGLKGGLQGAIYDYGIEKLFKEPVSGTIYNLLVKTKIPDYHRAYTKCNRAAIDRMLQTVEGVCRDIQRGDFYPSSNCFSYQRECDYLHLCNYDSPEVREVFYQKRKETANGLDKRNEGETG